MASHKDEKILAFLRENARTNLTTISRKTGIPVSTIFDRLRSHQGRLIKKFTVLLDFSKMGFPIRTSILLRVVYESRDAVKAYLQAHPQVNTLLRVNNGYDFAIDAFFRDVREVEDFIEDLECKYKVEASHVLHIIDEIALESAFAGQFAPG